MALKVLGHDGRDRFELFGSAARQRLLREARAQARVRHDAVLPVYDTGERERRPYIAMRWVEGPTLGELRGKISPEQTLRLVAEVAEGLHAAHREGLIHRDVKPANILCEECPDGGWRPWVTDFGIALGRTGPDGETVLGPCGREVAGTLGYMAPEVLAGDLARVDRRADVYGLGATLYALLTGRPPHGVEGEEETAGAVLRRIAEVDAADPREREPSVPAEVAAICLRCLARDPDRRYASARAVAADLGRYLNGEVVEAYTATLAYRLVRFVERHRLLVSVVSTAAVLLVIALGVAAFLGAEARAANRQVETRREQAEDLLGFMLTDLRDKLAPMGQLSLLDDLGRQSLEYFSAMPEGDLSEEELSRRARALYQLGEVRIDQGDPSGALEPLRLSRALNEALAARRPPGDPGRGDALFELGQAEYWVGYALRAMGRHDEARPRFEAYHDLSEELVALDPAHRGWRMELAYAESNLGSLAQDAGRYEEALHRFREVEAAFEELARDEPDDPLWVEERAVNHNLIGEALRGLGRSPEAVAELEAELALRRRLVERRPDNADWKAKLGTSHDFLSSALLDIGEAAGALRHLTEARTIFEQLVALDPTNATWQYKLAMVDLKVAIAILEAGDVEAALDALERPGRIARDLVGTDASQRSGAWLLSMVLYYQADAAYAQGRGEEARRTYDRAQTALRGVAEKDVSARENDWLQRVEARRREFFC